jgi:threonine dehydrogenase-like Zn-dependent dehydrogenase
MMKAVVLHGNKQLTYEDWAKPEINNGKQVLVEVKVSGFCGSDLPRVFEERAHFYPIILGHEFSGLVVECGTEVSTLSVGDKISCIPLIPDMHDPNSLMGNYALGKNYSFVGSRIHGGWAEYVVLPEENAFHLPVSCGYKEGAFLEPLTVALHALNIMDYQGGKTVAVTGMGTIGLLTMQCARILGARKICVFDIDEQRLEAARDMGADFCVNTADPDHVEKALGYTNGKGFEVVLETAGVPFTEILALKLAGAKGSVMFIGTPHKNLLIEPEVFELINRKELHISGSWMSYSAPFPGWEWEFGSELLADNRLSLDPLIAGEFLLSEAPSTILNIGQNAQKPGKLLFSVNGGSGK